MTPNRQPVYFVPHGAGPCFFMDWDPPDAWTPMAAFLKGLVSGLPMRPRAVVVVSAHWLAPEFRVTASVAPSLIYDYYGFPEHTYAFRFPAPGDPVLAAAIVARLSAAGLATTADEARGFDHGVFIPLLLSLPQADLPVVQLSLQQDMAPALHLQAGRALQGLRDEGVLIVGSGMSFHNMRGYGDPRFGPISDEFDHWLSDTVAAPAAQRAQRLRDWETAPSARQCHPPRAEEHLLPLMVVAGAAGEDAGERVFSDRVLETTLSAYRFG